MQKKSAAVAVACLVPRGVERPVNTHTSRRTPYNDTTKALVNAIESTCLKEALRRLEASLDGVDWEEE